ncbi:MAG: acyltransferase [Lachnospiraceae bacterium]|nr:acyltransferase [Lachnospiraceae bacterium]
MSGILQEGCTIDRKTSGILRGVAILIVIASHYAEWMWVEPAHPQLAHAISTWGPEGVAVFFLLSGYGLYKSADKSPKGIDALFVLKRFLAVYLPYLILAFAINCYSGGWEEADASAVLRFFLAEDYWYINVLLFMYLAFMMCFRFGRRLRIPLLLLLLVIQFIGLHKMGYRDFWTLSNPAFALGLLAAAAEKKWDIFRSLPLKLGILGTGLCGLGLSFVMMQRCGGSGAPGAYKAELCLVFAFSLAVLGLAYLLPAWRSPVLGLLGEVSLFIYLLHTVFFYAIMSRLENWEYAWANMLTALITLLVSALIGKGCLFLTGRLLSAIGKKDEKQR